MTAMEEALGTTFDVFIIITIIVMGFTAYMTGQELMANEEIRAAYLEGGKERKAH